MASSLSFVDQAAVKAGAASAAIIGIGFGRAKWQAASWPGATSRSAGRSSAQIAWASGQRVWKLHPDGTAVGLGTSPCRMMRAVPSGDAGLGRGREQRLRIGMLRSGEDRVLRAYLDDAAEIHHRDAVGDVPDDARGRAR